MTTLLCNSSAMSMRSFTAALMVAACLGGCDAFADQSPFQLTYEGRSVLEGPTSAIFLAQGDSTRVFLNDQPRRTDSGTYVTLSWRGSVQAGTYCVATWRADCNRSTVAVEYGGITIAGAHPYEIGAGTVTVTQATPTKLTGRFTLSMPSTDGDQRAEGVFEATPRR